MEITSKTGSLYSFEVYLNDKLIFSKIATGRFPYAGEINVLIGNELGKTGK